MQITHIEVKGFRSLYDVNISTHDLTLLIGENDAGKSSVLDILEIFLDGKYPDDDDFYKELGQSGKENFSETICVTISFRPDEWDKPLRPYLDKHHNLILKKEFGRNGDRTTWFKGKKFEDENLNQDFSKLSAGEFDALLDDLKIDIEGRRNNDMRMDAMQTYLQTADEIEDWITISEKDVKSIMPIFERYRAIDYTQPETFVKKTLQNLYTSMIYKKIDDKSELIDSLKDLQNDFTEQANTQINNLKTIIHKYHQQIIDIIYTPIMDFSKGFTGGDFYIDDGRGPHRLMKTGDGTRRRILMATVDWSNQVIRETLENQTIIRGYDEPDSNLHYYAQRNMYDGITDITGKNDEQSSRVQSLICTHSLPMIDKAPATNINQLSLISNGQTEVKYLRTDDDETIEEFINAIARELGITNTMLFYERCYLIVEGATEENALPILYRQKYSSSMIDDGIRLINIEGNGGWLGLLRLLGKNREHNTLMLLDSDTKNDYEKKFEQAGLSDSFKKEQTYWAGINEFEDEFTDDIILNCLHNHWKPLDGNDWEKSELEEIRNSAKNSNRKKDKFSEQLKKKINSAMQGQKTCTKAEFGISLARTCSSEDIPESIINLFESARKIANS